MAGWRQAVALAMTGEEIGSTDGSVAVADRTGRPGVAGSDAARRYREKPSFFAVGRRLGVHHQTVQRCVERAMAYVARLRHLVTDRDRAKSRRSRRRPRPGWYLWPATRPRSTGFYPHELWTTRLSARHARERGPAAGHQCLAPSGSRHRVQASRSRGNQAAQGALLLWNRRDAEFEPEDGGSSVCLPRGPGPEKSRCQGGEIEEAGRDRLLRRGSLGSRPSPRRHRICRQCQAAMRASRGIMSTNAMARSACWPGSICSPASVHALVRERHRSREFIEFLKLLDAAYPASTANKLILDNHSAHISRETPSLARHPAARPAPTLPSRPSTAPGST